MLVEPVDELRGGKLPGNTVQDLCIIIGFMKTLMTFKRTIDDDDRLQA